MLAQRVDVRAMGYRGGGGDDREGVRAVRVMRGGGQDFGHGVMEMGVGGRGQERRLPETRRPRGGFGT